MLFIKLLDMDLFFAFGAGTQTKRTHRDAGQCPQDEWSDSHRYQPAPVGDDATRNDGKCRNQQYSPSSHQVP
jgi:hypothetical protein